MKQHILLSLMQLAKEIVDNKYGIDYPRAMNKESAIEYEKAILHTYRSLVAALEST